MSLELLSQDSMMDFLHSWHHLHCCPNYAKNPPERKTSLEQLSFERGQVSSRGLAKAELLATGFLAIEQLRPELPPSLVISRLQVGCLEFLSFGHDHGHQADGAAHHHSWNGTPASRGSPLMRTGHAKTMLQVIVGARQIWHIIAMK